MMKRRQDQLKIQSKESAAAKRCPPFLLTHSPSRVLNGLATTVHTSIRAALAFISQCQGGASRVLSPLVFFPISTHFTATLTALQLGSFDRYNVAVDRISELPVDILISIISQLTLQEATATSILSTRWRDLYTYIDHLIFPLLKPIPQLGISCRERQEKKKNSDYRNIIDHTLDSYKGTGVLKEFRVHVKSFREANIKRWLEFALARKVEIIDIKIRCMRYALQLSDLIRTNDRSLPGLKSLKKLSLNGVDVDDQEVQLLLSNFPLLESLSIKNSTMLKNVEIVGDSVLKLKHLYICCPSSNLESIKINNMMNLVSLRCYRRCKRHIVHLNNVPKLTEFGTDESPGNTLAEILTRIPYHQLRLLNLRNVTCMGRPLVPTYELINIKVLELEVEMVGDCYLYRTAVPVIEACRLLEKLEVKFYRWVSNTQFRDRRLLVLTRELSPNLKTVVLSGYLGCPSELEFAWCIMKNVATLEELIVRPCDMTPEIQRDATRRAREHFGEITPKLTII